nr:histidine kinase dimerization/phospho-acceptor domain-containing protein [Candidatus Krumholzibacteria bacterium]
MGQTRETKNLSTIILCTVLVCAVMPLLLSAVGVEYGPASRGGAGAHFAGLAVGENLVRFDVPALGLLLFLGILGAVYHRVAPNRFVTLMAFALLTGGLAQAVLIIPPTHTTFARQVVISTTWGHLGFALILLAGALHYQLGQRNLRLLLVSCGTLLLATWGAMAWYPSTEGPWAQQIQIAAMGLLLVTGVALRPTRPAKTLHFFRLGIIALIIPLVSGLLWLHSSDQTVFHQGFHVATLMWWMAILLPVLGLGIDYIFAFYGQGMASEKHYLRQVIDAIPHFIFARDDQGNFTLVNKAVADFYGKGIEEIEGHHVSKIHHDRTQWEKWLAEDQAALAAGKSTSMDEDETRDHHGNPMWIDAIKTPLTGQGVSGPQVLGISIDITPQKKAEVALARRLRFELTYTSVLRQLLRCTVDNLDSQMGIILREVALFAQAQRCAVYRQDDDKRPLFQWSDEDNHGPETPATLTIPIVQGGEKFGSLLLNTARSRSWTPDETTLLQNIADLFITVWSKIEAEKKLTETMEKAKASSRAKSEFLANMSHEIRTPMNCVIGISELLGDMDPTPSQRQYLEMISQSGNSLLALINDILDLSKIEAGQLELDPVKVNLREMVEEVVGLIAFNAQAKGLEMVCRYA